jgi:hypothetical protein
MKKILLALLVLSVSFPVVAENAEPQETPAVDCEKMGKEIKSLLVEPTTCFRDSECKLVSWGCPWQLAPCHFSIYSTSEEDRNKELSAKVTLYSNICMRADLDMKEKCGLFYAEVEKNQCQVRTELACVDGICSTPTDIILQMDEDAADIYGSREILGE